MRKTVLLLIVLLLLSGCSKKNAFFAFHMEQTQELGASSLQSSKIISKDGEVKGVFSSIYLNEVYPKEYQGEEHFLILLYLKEHQELYDPQSSTPATLQVTLNKQPPLKVEKLPKEHRFVSLTQRANEWSDCYLVTFETTEQLTLFLQEQNFQAAHTLGYSKEK